MMAPDYTGVLRWVYDWQTMIAGIVAVVGAIGGGVLAYLAGKKQADATRKSARDQIAALEQQNADLKLAGQRRLAQERKDVAGLLYASVGIVIAQIEAARSGLIDPLPAPRANAIRQTVGKPGFTYLWERLGVFEGEIVVAFLNLNIGIDAIKAGIDDTDVGRLGRMLDGLSTLAERLRALASGEMERAKAILPADELPPH
jgi:hypothetical protein